MPTYHPKRIEPKWQAYWRDHATFKTDTDLSKPKYYVLDMFPYPSGAGLHVGHPEGYTATDILARYKRMRGFRVLHPMGWDAFGLPAEQYAVETGTHPATTTAANIATFRRQIDALGFSYDWDREVNTTDPAYVKWTQWIFLQLYNSWFDPDTNRARPVTELPIPDTVRQAGPGAVADYTDGKRLAYVSDAPVNWCPALGTVLANEEVKDGLSERGGHPVERRPLRQWMLRITAYAQRLLDDLDTLDWSAGLKAMQRDWIGRSEGAEVRFPLADGGDGSGDFLEVFTTRPDTLFGATYMVVAPEHPLVARLTTAEQREAVHSYQAAAARKSERDRQDKSKKKTGVWTGSYAVNPLSGEKVPVWAADYVLAGYGTGAIMAVPAHDERDFAFAEQYGLPVTIVVAQPAGRPGDPPAECFTGDGVAVNSGFLNGLPTPEAKRRVTAHLEENGLGRGTVQFKLRDWLFSRQRYWGEPFPILFDEDGRSAGLMEEELPVLLPVMEDFKPSGTPEPKLSKAKDWVAVERDGKWFARETNTMPQWAGSCWYYLRYLDPHNAAAPWSKDVEQQWMPVDLYVGGAEHAVLHLLYARFWHKVLFDLGHVSTAEPFQRLVNQGMILGEYEYHADLADYTAHKEKLAALGVEGDPREASDGSQEDTYVLRVQTEDGPKTLPDELVERVKGKTLFKDPSFELAVKAEKMSKSRGNVVNPDDIIDQYGADALRLYEMFMGPLEAVKPWNTKGVEGVYRFLNRVWRLVIEDTLDEHHVRTKAKDVPAPDTVLRVLHRTVHGVTEDIEHLRFNTAIAKLMELSNALHDLETLPKEAAETLTLLLAPFAPHAAEELWQVLGHDASLSHHPWPAADAKHLVDDEVEAVVQVNGKVRAKLVVPAAVADEELKATARGDERVKPWLEGKQVVKELVVTNKGGKLVNLVVK